MTQSAPILFPVAGTAAQREAGSGPEAAFALRRRNGGATGGRPPRLDLLVAGLRRGETLAVRFDLWPSKGADRSISLVLSGRGDESGGGQPGEDWLGLGRAADQAAALRMCLPGYEVVPVAGLPKVSLVLLRPPEASRVQIAPAASKGIGEATGVLLPAWPPVEANVAGLIEALAASGRRAVLVASLARVTLAGTEIATLTRAEALLRTRAMVEPPGGPEAARVRFHLSHLALWKDSRVGTALSFGLAVEADAVGSLAELAQGLLYGRVAGSMLHAVEAAGPPALDLSLALPSPVVLPALLPQDADLDRLGFFGRRSWRGGGLPQADVCRIGTLPSGTAVTLGQEALCRHVYLVGATGVGKSTQMAGMIRQDVAQGRGTILIDPHGDLVGEVLEGLSTADRARTRLVDLCSTGDGFGIDLLSMPAERRELRLNVVCNQLIATFRTVLYRDQPEGFGPMFEAYFRNALMLLVLGSAGRCSLVDFDRVFGEPAFRSQLLDACPDETVVRFWRQTAIRAGGEAALENIAPYIVSKLTQFTGNPLVRPIIDGSCPPVELGRVFGGDGILLVNLAKGAVGEMNAALVGAMVCIEIFAAALARGAVPRSRRSRVRLYLDEFQTYATDVLAQMLCESRKFGLELTLANQSLGQVGEERGQPGIAGAILANVGTVMAFRTGPRDARILQDLFTPAFDAASLMHLPDHVFVTRQVQDGQLTDAIRVRGMDREEVPPAGGRSRGEGRTPDFIDE